MKWPRWGFLKKFDFNKKEERLKFLIIALSTILFFSLSFAAAIKVTMSPQFCSTCHEMTPEYVTWKASAHSLIACTDCHIKPGLANLIVHKVSASKEVFLHFTDSYEKPIKMGNQIDQDVCKVCHSTNRSFTYSGDLIVPHEKHSKKGINCVACHSGVAHGNIASRELTKDGKYSTWTQQLGSEQMVRDNEKPKMTTCLDCHAKRGVTQKCEACHSVISVPPDHKDPLWKNIHGKKAEKDLTYCNKCHSYSADKSKTTIADYARGNSFCSQCHKKRPAGHGDDWLAVHSSKATPDKTGCLVCHDKDKPQPEENITTTYCSKCHGNTAEVDSESKAPDKPKEQPTADKDQGAYKYHDSNWRKNHPLFIKEQGIQKGKCFSCHETSQCSKCHTSNGNLH